MNTLVALMLLTVSGGNESRPVPFKCMCELETSDGTIEHLLLARRADGSDYVYLLHRGNEKNHKMQMIGSGIVRDYVNHRMILVDYRAGHKVTLPLDSGPVEYDAGCARIARPGSVKTLGFTNAPPSRDSHFDPIGVMEYPPEVFFEEWLSPIPE